MEIISYIDSSDGFTHYLFVPSYGMPLLLRIFMVGAGLITIYLIFKKIIG